MATIPVYLTDDDGNEIEQTSGSGDFIIVGYVNQDLFANTSGLLSTTFFDVVQAATPEEKAEVLRGLRLAKGIRGDLRRFELSGTSGNAYVKYNHSIFGGRFQSQYTALGAIAGTYLRRGGSAFTKELVEAALISGAYANFSDFPGSPVLPGPQEFTVNAGGGTVSAYAWTITDGSTTFSPTGSSVTETLTVGSWAVSCDVTIDGDVISVASQSLTVANLAYAGDMTISDPTPTLGETITLGLPFTNGELLGDITWSFNVELAAGQRVALTEGVDYTATESGSTISITFLTAGSFEATATAEDTAGTSLATRANLDVADYATTNTVTEHSILSQATADALVQGDTHLIVLGDSIMNLTQDEWWRRGIVDSWEPARWAGIQPSVTTTAGTTGTNNMHDGVQWIDSSVTRNEGSGQNSTIVKRDGTKSGITVMDSRLGERRTQPGTFTQLTSTGSGSRVRVSSNVATVGTGLLRGRLQSSTDRMWDNSSVASRVLLYNLDGTPTLRATADDASGADEVVTMSADSYELVQVARNAATGGTLNRNVFDMTFDSITSGDKFGVMDSFLYSPAISGLSLSYLGDGGWNTSNHTDDASRVNTNATTRLDQYYDDEACEQHLKMVAFKDAAQTTQRDNIFLLLEIQNGSQNSEGHDGQMRTDLLAILTRWKDAADVVDPSGTLKGKLRLIVIAMPDITQNNQHGQVASMMPDLVGFGGYDAVEFIDLHNAIKSAEGGIYADPADYTDTWDGSAAVPASVASWYSTNASNSGIDGVHPTLLGARKQMEIFWSVVEDAAADPVGFSFSINAPSNGTTADTFNYTLSGSLPTDRLVTWFVDDVETAYGDAYTLPSSVGTFVVKAVVDGLDGAQTTVTASAVTVSAANSAPTITVPMALGGSNPAEGESFVINVTATDADGDNLTYSLTTDGTNLAQSDGPLASGVQASFNLTAGTAGAAETFSLTVTDGSLVDTATFAVTPDVANTAPAISSNLAVDGSNPVAGASFDLKVTATDVDGDSLTYTLSADGSPTGDTEVAAAGAEVTFTVTAGTAGVAVNYSVSVSDGTDTASSALSVTPDAANTAPVISSDISASGATTEGDTFTVTTFVVSDAEDAVTSLTYLTEVSIDGGAFSAVSTGSTGNVPSNGVILGASHLASVAGDYEFRTTVTDTGGLTAVATTSGATTIAVAPSETKVGTLTVVGSGGSTPTSTTTDTGADDFLHAFISPTSVGWGDFRWSGPAAVRMFFNNTGSVSNAEADAVAAAVNGSTHEIRVVSGSDTYTFSADWANAASNRIEFPTTGTITKNGSTVVTSSTFRSSIWSTTFEAQIWEL